jgi:hypothetical protein
MCAAHGLVCAEMFLCALKIHALTVGNDLLVVCTVTIGNIRETHRFSPSAWRLVGMIPARPQHNTADNKPHDKLAALRVYHQTFRAIFKNYNKIIKEGLLVQCSDLEVRNLAPIPAMFAADGPEIHACCCMVQVSNLMYVILKG